MTYATVCIVYASYLNTSNNLQNLSTRIDHIESYNKIMVQKKFGMHFTSLAWFLKFSFPCFFIWQSVTVKDTRNAQEHHVNKNSTFSVCMKLCSLFFLRYSQYLFQALHARKGWIFTLDDSITWWSPTLSHEAKLVRIIYWIVHVDGR